MCDETKQTVKYVRFRGCRKRSPPDEGWKRTERLEAHRIPTLLRQSTTCIELVLLLIFSGTP